MPFELFHLVADPASARARRFITARELEPVVEFCNVSFDGSRGRLHAHGGAGTVPALWDGEQLFVGADAAIARLLAYLDPSTPLGTGVGRPE